MKYKMILDFSLLIGATFMFYFIYEKVFSVFKIDPKRKTGILSLGSSFIVLILLVFPSDYYQFNSFDKMKWNKINDRRYKMSKGLMTNHIRIGMSKTEIIELLGEGSDYYSFRDSTNLYYYLGFTPGIYKLDPDFLGVYFEDSLVVGVEQFED
jgi:hypothetical protein